MSVLFLFITKSCVLFNCPAILVPGTQAARWRQVHCSNKPFYMLCLKTAQDWSKIKRNHLASTHFFLFLLSLSNPALLDRIAQLEANNLKCQTCHTENCSLKILICHVAFREPLLSSSSQSSWVRGKWWEQLVEKGTPQHLASNSVCWTFTKEKNTGDRQSQHFQVAMCSVLLKLFIRR